MDLVKISDIQNMKVESLKAQINLTTSIFFFFFFVVKIRHFSILKKSQATWSMEHVGKFPKTLLHLRKKVMKSPRFLEDLGGFFYLFILFFIFGGKSSYFANTLRYWGVLGSRCNILALFLEHLHWCSVRDSRQYNLLRKSQNVPV